MLRIVPALFYNFSAKKAHGLRAYALVLPYARPRYATRMRARRLPQPAAGPANGGGAEVLSVVPRGGSSGAVESERSRIDWNNRCALVRVSLLLNIDPVPRLSSRVLMSGPIKALAGWRIGCLIGEARKLHGP